MSSFSTVPAGAGGVDAPPRGLLGRVGAWVVNRSIRTKLLAAIALLSVVAVTSGIVAARGLDKAGSDIKGLAQVQVGIGMPLQKAHQDEIKARLLVDHLALTTTATKGDWQQKIKDNDA